MKDAEICEKECDHRSPCLALRGHTGGHDTQHGCTFYDTSQLPPDWETRYRTLEVIAQKRLDELVRLIEENSELRRRLGHGR